MNYKNRKCLTSDRIINDVVIKNIIKIRGSRKLFRDASVAASYIDSIESGEFDYVFKRKIDSPVSKYFCNKTECLVFGDAMSENVVVYFHGGAFVRHITELHIKMIDRLCKNTGAMFVVPLYLKAPMHTWKESYEDITEVYRTLSEKKNGKNIILMGDSCGGTIAVSLLTTLKEQNLDFPDKLVLLSPLMELNCKNADMKNDSVKDPMFGGTDGIQEFIDGWAGGTSLDSPYINPMNVDFSDLPETHIYTGKSDMLYHDCIKFYDTAKNMNANVAMTVYDRMFHVFELYPLKAAKEVLSEVEKIIS